MLRKTVKLLSAIAIGLLLNGCSGEPEPAPASAPTPPAEDAVVTGYSLGTVTELNQTCAAGTQLGVECRTLEVACPDLPAIQLTLQINAPSTAATPRGTIVFSSGGGGTGYYAAPELFQALQDKGFRVVDRAWAETWYGGGQGIRKGACHYATLATWVHQNVHTGGAFCGSGNSGGAAEVGHAMATYGRGAIFDHVMPTGGPAVARLDYACLGQNNPEWLQQCDALIPDSANWQCTPACTLGEQGGVCSAIGANPTEHDLLYDSVLAPDALLKYTHTKMDFIEGTQDCQISPVMGTLFHNTVLSLKSLQYVRDTPHAVSSTAAGRSAMVDAFDRECIVRH